MPAETATATHNPDVPEDLIITSYFIPIIFLIKTPSMAAELSLFHSILMSSFEQSVFGNLIIREFITSFPSLGSYGRIHRTSLSVC